MSHLNHIRRLSQSLGILIVCSLVANLLFAFPSNLPESTDNIPTESIPTIARPKMVVLLHGVLKSSLSMERLERSFKSGGYKTFNWNYDSNDFTVIQNAVELDSLIRLNGYDRYRLDFVTHSMGGIIIRYYLENYPPPHLGRLVMIAPPNQGSHLATFFQNFPPFKWLYKKTVTYLVTGDDAFAPHAGIPSCEFGIIAGGTGGKYGYTWYLPGDDDGTISVSQTKLKGASDFIILHHIHSVLPLERDTIEQTRYFIEHGRFMHQQLTEADDL